jgi:hypothetical protein
MKRKSIVGFCLFIISISNLLAQELLKIDIESKIDEKDLLINLSDYIEKIEYLQLDSHVDFLIDAQPEFTVKNKEIVVRTISNCFVFDRGSGKFLQKVGNKGRGPAEYRSTGGLINPKNHSIYFVGQGAKLLKFNFDGTFNKSIVIPEYNDGFVAPSLPINYTWLKNDIVFYFADMIGTERKRLMIINEEGEKLVVHPKYKYFTEKKGMAISLYDSQFYHFKNDLYFKEDYSDTVFKVSEKELIPSLILYLGKYQPSIESKWMTAKEKQNQKHEFIGLRKLIESESFFLFEFYSQKKHFQGVFNKNTDILKIVEMSSGINNDIDRFIPFSPVSISTDGYLIGYVEAYVLLAWFMQNPEKAAKLPLHLQKLKNINESDNPVVMIAKLK